MECWKNAGQFERRVFSLAKNLFADSPWLLAFTFDPTSPRLRCSVDELLAEARGLSSGESVLVRIAVDLWCDEANVRLGELRALDQVSLDRVLRAIFETAA